MVLWVLGAAGRYQFQQIERPALQRDCKVLSCKPSGTRGQACRCGIMSSSMTPISIGTGIGCGVRQSGNRPRMDYYVLVLRDLCTALGRNAASAGVCKDILMSRSSIFVALNLLR